jgi:hypothetical protein
MTMRKPNPSSWFDIEKIPSTLLQATSAEIDAAGKTFVVLTWALREDVLSYNLYRSVAGRQRPKLLRPINGRQPIEPVKTCAQLKKIIPEGSREWIMLTNGFTSLAARQNLRTTADAHNRARFTDRAALAGIRSLPIDPLTGEKHVDFALPAVDPCTALNRGLTPAEEDLFDTLAHGNLKMRLARGMAYIDRRVSANQHYVYELRGVLRDGSEVSLARGVAVWAGHFILPDPPSGLSLSAGDHKVLSLWNRNPYAYSYMVQRSTNSGGPFQVVNPEAIIFDVDKDIQDQPIVPPQPGFLDFQRWDANGLPENHLVNGLAVVGPENGTTYYYRVASQDILDRTGSWCAALSTAPLRSIPPMAPDELQVSPQLVPPGLVLSWRKVTRDIDNHQLPDIIQTYYIYRSDSREALEDIATLPTKQVNWINANPQDPSTSTLSWTDTDPVLVPAYGEKTYYYRLRCTDPVPNISSPSAIIGGRVPDTTPPGPTDPDGADGYPDHIRVYWKPNSEPDLAGYQIYRGVCDRGFIYRPGNKERPTGKCDLTLVGQVTLGESKDMLNSTGKIYFDDFSLPEGSPLCYAYWVRAYDVAQNLYQGNGGCPARREEYVCMRLLEKTPPPAPVITGLRARNNAVLVEWIASPVQDLRAFHIYRSDKELDPPVFIACVLTNGSVFPTPWPGLPPSCADIPAEPDPLMARGHFLDATAVPNQVYWYRVSALDWLGNESEGGSLGLLPASSTFTYTSDLPVTPAVLPLASQPASGCGLEVRWGPAFDPALLEGFVVFRGISGGPYRQVSNVVAGNAFSDPSARRGVDYWYCVQSVDKAGRLSRPSVPVLYRY